MIKSQSYNSQSGFIIVSAIFLVSLAVALFSSWYWIMAIPFGILFFYFSWQHYNLIFFLLIFFLPWSVEYNFNASFGTDLPDEPLMLLAATLFTCRFFFRPTDISWVWKHSLILLLFVYFGWIVVTVPFSTDWILSTKFLLAKSWYILAFVFAPFLVLKNKKSIRAAGIVFLLSMLSLVIIVLFRHALLGFTFANINNAVNPFFRNHVNYSAMLVCTLPVLVAAYQSNKRFRALIFIAAIVVLIALFLSYSRGAWLALLVGIISYWLIQKKKLLFAFLVSVVLILASVFWVSKNDRYLDYANDFKTTIFHKNFEKHLIATYKLKDVSTAERFNRWIAGARMTKDNLLTGFGPNTFYNNYKPYTLPAFKTWVSRNTEHSTVHNYFLLILIEQGIPGLVFFLLLVCGVIYYSEKLYARISDPFYKAAAMACGVMVMMIITVNFLSDLIETDKVGSLFFLCLSLLVIIDINTRNAEIESLDAE
ncbi:MAG TPA: O-antigen ligase family protein [Chitinophagaceae bacterium]|nr:O-antigen ligase family protein [Chitinophagaceae bacterium]